MSVHTTVFDNHIVVAEVLNDASAHFGRRGPSAAVVYYSRRDDGSVTRRTVEYGENALDAVGEQKCYYMRYSGSAIADEPNECDGGYQDKIRALLDS